MQTVLTFSLAFVCLWLIVTPRYHTGITITAGLGLLACGILASLDEAAFGDRATRLQLWGLFAVLWGFAWRLALRPGWLALSMRWEKAHTFARFWGLERRNARRSER